MYAGIYRCNKHIKLHDYTKCNKLMSKCFKKKHDVGSYNGIHYILIDVFQ